MRISYVCLFLPVVAAAIQSKQPLAILVPQAGKARHYANEKHLATSSAGEPRSPSRHAKGLLKLVPPPTQSKQPFAILVPQAGKARHYANEKHLATSSAGEPCSPRTCPYVARCLNWRSKQESNPHQRYRKPLFYPLDYWSTASCIIQHSSCYR